MLEIIKELDGHVEYTTIHDSDHIVAYARGDYVFVFNFHPSESFEDYTLAAPAGEWKVVLSSDSHQFGGFDRIDTTLTYPSDGTLRFYVPSRTATVLTKIR